MTRLLLSSLCLLLAVHLGAAGDMEIKYITATGNIMVPSYKQFCSTATWIKDADVKKTVITKGDFTILMTDKTQQILKNTTSSKVECTDDSDDGFDEFDAYMKAVKYHELGVFDFVQPVGIGMQKAILFSKPISKMVKNGTAIMWLSNGTSWSGLDYLTPSPGKQGYVRFWWDDVDMTTKPPADSFNQASTCGQAVPADYTTPAGNCPFNGGKAFNLGAKSFVATGVRWYQDKDDLEKWGNSTVTIAVDKDNKKLAMFGGEGKEQWGMWTTKDGMYAMHPGKGCEYKKDMGYDTVIAGYNSPNVAWAGKAKIPKFGKRTDMAGESFDIYEGLLQKGRPYPAMLIVNDDGFIRAMSVIKGKGHHIHFDRTFFDDIKAKTPEAVLFTAPDRCLFPDSPGDTSAAPSVVGSLVMLLASALTLLM